MRLSLTKIKGIDLPKETLPNKHLQVASVEVEDEKFERLSRALPKVVDPILQGLAVSLGILVDVEVSVVATAGLPRPYDAWTAHANGKTTIYFNLSQWTSESLDLDVPAISMHEVTHLLLHPILFREGELSYREQLELIVLDEGIAHYIGFAGDREVLLSKYLDQWKRAESELSQAYETLESSEDDAEQKRLLLERSNTGPFWEKFGAIAGMFRTARIFQEHGIEGLSKAVRQRCLPRCD